METSVCYRLSYPISSCKCLAGYSTRTVVIAAGGHIKKPHNRKIKQPLNLRYPRRAKAPPDFHPVLYQEPREFQTAAPSSSDQVENDVSDSDDGDNIVWDADEIEAISSLFQGRIPQKPGKLSRERPLPLPLPHRVRPLGLPTRKQLTRTLQAVSERQPVTNQVYKNPAFLIGLAREIRNLPPEEDVSSVLNQWSQFLRKGSLSLTVRELGHMGLPERALNVYCWAERQPHLFPDDRILGSTVEILARSHELKMPFDVMNFCSLASRSVYEAMVRGFIKGGNLGLAWHLLKAATETKRMLDPGVYAKLILQLVKNPEKKMVALPLLEELGKRENLQLTQQDCTAVMKACIKMGKFDVVEALYDWFKKSGKIPSVVMQTTLIHSRYSENKFRDAMTILWEMEASSCTFDLPAYGVLIKLFVALNDHSRTSRYFSKLKESGFAPTYVMYRDVIRMHMASGRWAKCREIFREAEMAGFKWDEPTRLQFMELEKNLPKNV